MEHLFQKDLCLGITYFSTFRFHSFIFMLTDLLRKIGEKFMMNIGKKSETRKMEQHITRGKRLHYTTLRSNSASQNFFYTDGVGKSRT